MDWSMPWKPTNDRAGCQGILTRVVQMRRIALQWEKLKVAIGRPPRRLGIKTEIVG